MASGSVNPTSTCAEGFLPGLWSSLWPERSAGMITPVLRAPGVTTSRRSTSRGLIAPPGTDWLPRRLSTKRPVVGNAGRLPGLGQGRRSRSGAGGHVGGQDVVRVAVEVLAG